MLRSFSRNTMKRSAIAGKHQPHALFFATRAASVAVSRRSAGE
jgi:hypothetical protein